MSNTVCNSALPIFEHGGAGTSAFCAHCLECAECCTLAAAAFRNCSSSSRRKRRVYGGHGPYKTNALYYDDEDAYTVGRCVYARSFATPVRCGFPPRCSLRGLKSQLQRSNMDVS